VSRRRGREFALQILFQDDVIDQELRTAREVFWEINRAGREARQFAESLVETVIGNQVEIDDLIRRHSLNWRLERLAAVDRNVLRLAIAELLYLRTPKAVAIDEAIEVARKYGTGKSAEFVNGILDAVIREREGRPA
jgi:N utilization substance protein B